MPAVILAADPAITEAEREKAVRLFEASRAEFLGSIDGLSEAQWKWKPAPTRWSVGEVAEHIVLAEALLFGKVNEAVANQPNPDWERKTAKKTEFLERVMPARTGRAQAPEEIVPEGKLSRDETLKRFDAGREPMLKFAKETQAPLKQQTAEHPFPVFNTLNAYQWLLYIPLHTQRHVKQIEEVKATEGYPKD